MDLYRNMTDHDYHILFHIQFFTYHFTYKFTTWAPRGPSLVRSQRVTMGAFSLYTPEISAQNRYPQGLANPPIRHVMAGQRWPNGQLVSQFLGDHHLPMVSQTRI